MGGGGVGGGGGGGVEESEALPSAPTHTTLPGGGPELPHCD